MGNRGDQTPQEWYTHEIMCSLSACRHYLDKVDRVNSTDVHERSKHHNNLRIMTERLEAWLSSGKTDLVEEWRKVAKHTNDTAWYVGLAAVWLQEIADIN